MAKKERRRKIYDGGPVGWVFAVAVRAVFSLMMIFPIDRNLKTARFLAKMWIRITPKHRDRAIEHLRLAYGDDLSEAELQRIAERSLESLVMFAVEVGCMPHLIKPLTWSRYFRLSNFEETLDVMSRGTGAIMVTAHFGSFELMGQLIAALGFDVVAVMRPIDNPWINDYLVSSRQRNGLQLLDKKGAMQHSESILERGGLLGFIADQDAGRKGIFVDFFGVAASTYKSIGLLAMQTSKPIVVAACRRIDDRALFEISVAKIIYPHQWEGKDDPLRYITEEYTSAIESFVRACPEQYLWIHRRWKSQPGRKRSRKSNESGTAGPEADTPGSAGADAANRLDV